MQSLPQAVERLSSVPLLQLTRNEPLAGHTRFALGGPADVFVETSDESAFVAALSVLRDEACRWIAIGRGSNLVVSDAGYRGIVLRYLGAHLAVDGTSLRAQAGALLQDVVDASVVHGLHGLESMTGIPGCLGAAIYGDAGAYGASISDVVAQVRFFDGHRVREVDKAACEFRYRDSIFKRRRLAGEAWLILSATLELAAGDRAALQRRADEILGVRNAKFPPDMKCAGSTFKNLILAELPQAARRQVPAGIVKGGKVPAAWFLEQVEAKGLACGGIRVADYHANTLLNTGTGTTAQFRELVAELKQRVQARFGIAIEEEVQYIGFEP